MAVMVKSIVLGLAFVYYYRLPRAEDRAAYWETLRWCGIPWREDWYGSTGWRLLSLEGCLNTILPVLPKTLSRPGLCSAHS